MNAYNSDDYQNEKTELLKNIYVINLDNNKNRLNKITENLNKYDLTFDRFSAIYGKNLSDEEIDKYTTFLCQYATCNKAIIGCFLSHLTLWKQIYESTNIDKWHLILEDDAEFNDNSVTIIKSIYENVKDEENIMITLSCIGPFCGTVGLHRQIQNLKIPLFGLGTGAYLITKNTAKKLYEYFYRHKINYHVDFSIVSNLKHIGISYYLLNGVVTNNSTVSSINNEGSLYLFSTLLKKIGLINIDWTLNVPVFSINMKHEITFMTMLFICLIFANIYVFKNKYITIYIILEIILTLLYK